MYHCFFIHSSVDGHLCCFHVLTIVNSAAMNIGVYVSFSILVSLSFPCGSAGKESACNARDLSSITGLGRSPGEGKGYPLQYSGLENGLYSPWGCKESNMTKRLSPSGCMPRSGIAGSHGGLIPSFLRNLHTIFHSGCINLHYSNARAFLFLHTLSKHLLFADFFMMAILNGVK